MTTPWTYSGAVPALSHADGVVTLVEGQTFCLSGRGGDFLPGTPHGLFVLDSRVLSRWELRVDGHLLEPLAVTLEAPFEATFVSRSAPTGGRADADLVVLRHRSIGSGIRERVVLRSYGLDLRSVIVELRCDADFAGLFEVKEGRVAPRAPRRCDARPNTLSFDDEGSTRRTEVSFSDAEPVEPGTSPGGSTSPLGRSGRSASRWASSSTATTWSDAFGVGTSMTSRCRGSAWHRGVTRCRLWTPTPRR